MFHVGCFPQSIRHPLWMMTKTMEDLQTKGLWQMSNLREKKVHHSFFKSLLYISDLISRADISLSIVHTRHLHQGALLAITHPYIPLPASASASKLDYEPDILKMISQVSVFHSAVATFYALSDISGIRGMRREHIRSTPSWHATGDEAGTCLCTDMAVLTHYFRIIKIILHPLHELQANIL